MGDEDGENVNIIKGAESEYEPKSGLGYEYFRFMRFYEKNISQYITETGQSDTYGSLLTRCIRTALKLKSQGLKQDDIICLCTYNHLNSCVPFIAATFLGVKVASLDPTLSVADTSHLLKQVKPKIIFLVPEAMDLIEKSLEIAENDITKLVVFGESRDYEEFREYLKFHEDEDEFKPVLVDPAEAAVIFFSSGTTGLPKGICQSGFALLSQGNNMINLGFISGPSLYYSSLYWISAAVLLTATILAGTARILGRNFAPNLTWKHLDRYRVSFLFLAPSQAIELLKVGRPDGLDTSNLLILATGGGILSEKHLKLLRDVLPGTFISQVYGQTEVAGPVTAFNINDVKDTLLLHYKPQSCGKPISGIHYKVVDPESGELQGPHKKGELRLKTRFAMTGYYNLDCSEAYDASGWLKTGDVVYYDEDNCFYVIDRIKEMLKYKSWHIPPAFLENVIMSHPHIKKAVVIGIPHEEDGDHAMAIVIADSDTNVTPRDIEEFVNSRVSDRQKLRAGVKFVEELPVTPSGKVKRQDLRNRVLAGEI